MSGSYACLMNYTLSRYVPIGSHKALFSADSLILTPKILYKY